MEALGTDIRESVELLDKRVLASIRRCWETYKLPVELSKLTPVYFRWAKNHGLAWTEYIEDLDARGMIHTLQLPTGKRLLFAMDLWMRMSAEERSELEARLLYIYVRKGHRFQSRAFKESVEISKGKVKSYPYDEIPKFFTKPDKEEPSDQ